jgi:hypothetical protein
MVIVIPLEFVKCGQAIAGEELWLAPKHQCPAIAGRQVQRDNMT